MSITLARILLATDGSEDAVLATRAAVDIAGKAGAELHVVHVWTAIPSARFESYIRTQLKQEAQVLLDEQVEKIEHAGGAVTQAHLREGRTADEIADLAKEVGADLVAMGSRGHGRIKGLILGSVSAGVVHDASCPMLVLRGGENVWPPERIVVGEDGSEAARRAGDLAALIGRLFGAKVLLVRVYPSLPQMDVKGRESGPRMVDDELRREERGLRERATEIGEILGARPEIRLTVDDDPAAGVLETARDEAGSGRTLVAVGSRGLGTMQRLTLGSVSTKVLWAAEGPVLVYPVRHGGCDAATSSANR
jgi:nucleotide-binding universal stress UspA family protein